MLHTSAIKEIIVTNNLSITSPRPPLPHGLLGFFLMFYFSKINNSKFHFHLLVNQKGLHLEYIKYISYGTPWLKKSQKTYISLLISPLLFDLSYSVDVKNDLENNTAALEYKIITL